MIVFVNSITPRIQYIFDWAGKEILGDSFQLTTELEVYKQYDGPRINYTPQRTEVQEFFIAPHTILFESGISPQSVSCFETDGYKAFFKTIGDMPFDFFAASFYLLSRYEEWLPHQKDMYGRYAHENSLAFREGFLHLPLVNTWIEDLKSRLLSKFDTINIRKSSFLFLPSYDIDMAWSYKHKGWWRSVGAAFKNIAKLEWRQLAERINVWRGKQKDPFDCFSWLNQLHQQYNLKPYYFFLLAGKPGKYDKNIDPEEKEMRELIGNHLIRYPVGIHPSWQSGDNVSLLKTEINTLSLITGNPVHASRQHYIRFELPGTFRQLIQEGIQYDFSMGYGSINGFRASFTSPYFWYDLGNETATQLMLFPFCFMEANSFYEQKQSAQQSLDELLHYYKTVKSVNGMFIMIWHNSFLGTDKLYAGWREMYEDFLKEAGRTS